MLRPSTQRLLTVSFFAATLAVLCGTATRALADAYTLTTIESTQRENFYGIDALGDFTVNRTATLAGPGHTCGGVANASNCYETFYVGNSTPVFSTAAPALTWDNGSVCTPVLGTGFSAINGLCNGTHFLASAIYSAPKSNDVRGTWAGPNPDPEADLLSNGLIGGGFINSNGDAVFIDAFHDTLVFADDLSTNGPGTTAPSAVPEPSTFALLGTGAVAVLGSLRRRASRVYS